MGFPFGAVADLVGAGLGFLGGQQSMGQQNAQFNASNVIAQQQLNFEQAAAHNGISWRVEDAKNAGISPLVALGAPTFNPGAISVSPTAGGNPYSSAAAGLSAMGQDLSRAAMAAATEKTRSETLLAIENARNNSELTKSMVDRNQADAALSRARAAMFSNPPMPSVDDNGRPIVGQGPSNTHFGGGAGISVNGAGGYVNEPPKLTTSSPASPSDVSGRASPGDQIYSDPGGIFYRQPTVNSAAGVGGLEGIVNFIGNRLNPFPSSAATDGIRAAARAQGYDDVVYLGFGKWQGVRGKRATAPSGPNLMLPY